ncbi:3-hydroxyacyl-CoA dehydrogenase NAD-binding domain-containing protein [Paenibacillus sp. CC-CFT747]|nr:3-hydroxyacyl-CoA dehydrogenase NAD-binding domain-containing protein [Paenibacillus sp. CC-CFT747]
MKYSKIGVIGVGNVGQGIAEMLSEKGLDVLLLDQNPERLEASLNAIEVSLDKQIERWGITRTEKKLILSRIHKTVTMEEMADCGLVIESISEELEAKKDIFRRLDRICGPEVILASTTSTLSVTELASVCDSPERVIGLHFLVPVSKKIDLVEIIRGIKTSEETFQNTKYFAEKVIEQKGIQVYESPGLVTTRLICTLINEAVTTLTEGVATAEDIDSAMRMGYDFRYGPLEMADRFGIDSVYAALERMFREYGDLKYRPSYLLKKMIRAGQLGVKSGEGFFRYDKDGDRL